MKLSFHSFVDSHFNVLYNPTKKSYPALTPLLGVKPPWDLSEKLLCDHTISDAAFQTVYEFGTGGLVAVEPDTYLCCNFKLLLPKIEDM